MNRDSGGRPPADKARPGGFGGELRARLSQFDRIDQPGGPAADVILDALGEAVLVLDARHRILYQGPGARRLLGYADGVMVGRLLPEFLDLEDQDPVMTALQALLDGQVSDVARLIRCRDALGDQRHAAMLARLVPDAVSGATSGASCIVVSLRDATERHEIEEVLRQARDRAEESGQAKSDFVAMMSHEIRTPMSGIIGLIDLLRTTDLSARQQEYVRALVQAGEHLSDLLNDILDFSKIEANRLEIEDVTFDLRKLTGAVMDIFRAKAEAKGVALRGSVAPDVPRWWRGDARHLRQVLANLVGNAVKFTDNGHVEIKITAEAPRSGSPLADGAMILHFAISDTGIGVSEAQKSLLFQPFVQADPTTTRRHGGTGLGLAISKRLVEAMQGSISATSQRHVGSTFRFSVPVHPVEAPPAVSAPAEPMRPLDGRVLVVDDSDLNRLVLGDMLERFGLTVSMARNGLEALDKVRQEPGFALIFMDIQMPVMDGFAAIEAIRKQERQSGGQQAGRPHRTPILALSATALREDRERAIALGCDDYVVKPLRKDVLLTLLRTYVPLADGGGLSADGGRPPRPVPEDGGLVVEPELAVLVPTFLLGVGSDLAGMRHALDHGDGRALARAAHTAKGNAMLFGFQALVEALRRIESVAHASLHGEDLPRSVAEPLLAAVEAEVEIIRRAAQPEA